jgi:hypothetical protein
VVCRLSLVDLLFGQCLIAAALVRMTQ